MPTVTTRKQLAQRTPSSTNACVLYQTTNANLTGIINTLIVCNTTNASKTYSIWVNQNGTAAADQFALVKDKALAANASDQYLYSNEASIVLVGANASILCSASAANTVTFTIYGEEILET